MRVESVLFNLSRRNAKDKLHINEVYCSLAESLAKEAISDELIVQNDQPLIQKDRIIQSTHFLRPNIPKPGSKRKRMPGRQCVVCKKRDIRRESSHSCRSCKVPLCITPCFELYQRRFNYSDSNISDDD